jgi:NAD(P)-dependent dehydrogenase (short-subunit alcohol dehydrogenase family)
MEPARSALVLGASGHIGGAIASELAKRGWRLGLHACLHPERCPAAPPGASAPPPLVYQADLRNLAEAEKLAADFLRDFGRLEALVWAAGLTRDAPAAVQPEAQLREVLALDLTAPFVLARAFVRQFLKQRAGAALFMASHAGLSGRAGGAAYAMAQSGLLALVRSLAREWGPSGLRVNALIPPFLPDSGLGRAVSPGCAAELSRRNVLKSQASSAETVKAVASLAVEVLDNPSVSGQVLVSDGRIAAG